MSYGGARTRFAGTAARGAGAVAMGVVVEWVHRGCQQGLPGSFDRRETGTDSSVQCPLIVRTGCRRRLAGAACFELSAWAVARG
jgi:hypothetical protein